MVRVLYGQEDVIEMIEETSNIIMGTYTFKQNNEGGLVRYRNGKYDGWATNPEFQLWQSLKEAKDALGEITPWLSASLSCENTHPCDSYIKACDKCSEAYVSLDTKLKGI